MWMRLILIIPVFTHPHVSHRVSGGLQRPFPHLSIRAWGMGVRACACMCACMQAYARASHPQYFCTDGNQDTHGRPQMTQRSNALNGQTNEEGP